MKRAIWMVPALLLLSFSAKAQETPAWEISGGYSFLKADFSGTNFSLNGGTGTITENVNHWFAGRATVSAYHGTDAGTTVSAQTLTYGPVFSYRHFNGFNPFVDVEIGGIRASEGYLGISKSAVKFAMLGGGGVDVRVRPSVSLRLQADYLMTRFLGANQNNLQGSAALVYHWGKK